MAKKRLSVATILIASIVVFSTLLLGSLGVVFWSIERDSRLEGFDRKAATMADQLATALSYPLWNYDEGYVARIVEGAFSDLDVRAVRLTRPSTPTLERSRSARGEIGTAINPNLPPDRTSQVREVVYGGRVLGRVELFFSTESLKKANRDDLIFLVGIVLGFNVFLVLGLYSLLWRLALGPLLSLDGYAQAVSSGEVDPPMPTEKFHGELLSLRESMARMVGLLQSRLSEIGHSERKLHSIFNNTSDAILVRRASTPNPCDHPITEVNDVACAKFGHSRGALLKKTLGELVSAGGAEGTEPCCGIGRFTLAFVRPDGETVTFELLTQPVEMEDGLCLITTGRDISERERAERERATLEEQLRQAHKMEAVGRLAGGVAHDFNNILTAVIGYCELSEMTPDTPQRVRENLARIKAASGRAATLTQQLLTFSRKQIIQPKAILLSDVVEEVHKILERILGEDVSLALDIAADAGSVYADPGQLGQVIMNLAINARDAMPSGGVVTLSIANVEAEAGSRAAQDGLLPGRYVLLSISDTGVGMDDEVRTKLFEPFFTTKSAGRGTGLGLATVHGIVTQSGGTIRVASSPGRGSTFRIYFPRHEGALHDPVVGKSEGPQGMQGGIETILVAEDSADVRAIVCGVLGSLGYRVLEASSGEEAEELAKGFKETIDLLLSDVVMPGISGKVLADRLGPERPGMSVIFMSGYTEDAIDRHGILKEGLNFIQKPFKARDLAAKVREVFDEVRT